MLDDTILEAGMDILEGRFKVLKKLGSGAFGEIYKVEKKKSGEVFAAKIEKAVEKQKHIMLFWESKLIHKMRGKTYVPQLYYIGTDKTNKTNMFHVMVMDMLGPSLEDLFQKCKRRFDLKTVCLTGMQMVKRIERVHEERIIHRDIKPDNFLIGGTELNKDNIYIIDFGLAKAYRDSEGKHIPYRDGKNLTGTARYASIATHKGKEQSRRDDLETIGHVLLYFLKGSLPWQGLPGKNKNDKYNAIKKKKLETPLEELCKGLPQEFFDFMTYCRALKFEQDPDYKHLTGLFESCMKRNNQDPKVQDFTWKQNRLTKDKEALKNSMLDVIRKKPKIGNIQSSAANAIAGPSAAGGGQAGYGAGNNNAQAGGAGQSATKKDSQLALAQGRATFTKKQFDGGRGSDFKKTAQQMFNMK